MRRQQYSAKALQAGALMAYSVSEFSDAKERCERAAVLCRHLGDTAGLGATLTFLGRLRFSIADLSQRDPDDEATGQARFGNHTGRTLTLQNPSLNQG